MKAVGFDIGTAFIASAQYGKAGNITARFVRDGFLKMKAIPQREEMLKRSADIFYVKKDKDLYVIGNAAFDMAVMFGQDLLRPLSSGVISHKEVETEFILNEILRQVGGDGEKGDIAYYSIPADPVDRSFNNVYHREMFKKFLEGFGYTATPMNEGMAVAYAELGDCDFTGLALSAGAGMANVALSYKGLEIFSFAIHNCGDWIDKQVAQVRGISTSDAAAEKEKPDFDLLAPKNDVEEAIQIYYKAMLEHVVEYMARAMEEHKSKIKIQNLPFVVAGGSSMPKGFLTLFARILKENSLPIPVGKLWQAKNPVMSVCKGCLIAAQKDLVKSTYDGVKDISHGDNKKHQYPQSFKEITEEIDKAKEEKTVLKAGAIADTQKPEKIKNDKSDKSNKEIREDKIKGQAMSQGLGLAQAIDLGSF